MGTRLRDRHLRLLASTILSAGSSADEVLEICALIEQSDFRNDLQKAVLGCLEVFSNIEMQEIEPPQQVRENRFKTDSSALSIEASNEMVNYMYELIKSKNMRRDQIISIFSRYFPAKLPSRLTIPELLLFYVRHLPVETIHTILKNDLLDRNLINKEFDGYLDGILRKRNR